MSGEGKDHRTQIIVAIIGLIGTLGVALIGNWGNIRGGDDTSPPLPGPVADTTPVDGPVDPGEPPALTGTAAKREAERIAGQWVEAIRAGDVETLVRISGVPFYLDQDSFILSESELRTRYGEMVEEMDEGLPSPDSILSYTLAEYEALGYAETDRIVARLNLSPGDLVVGVFFGGEGVAFFFRNLGASLELVGMWD
jgi:hypothetical protein